VQLTFTQYTAFVNRWKYFRLDDEDLRAIERHLLDRPFSGAVMRGTGGLRKLRFSPPSLRAGKSGAYRVCYSFVQESAEIHLLAVFAKSEVPN
jgi:mRNA-degrading endonuclease RelE of RelBE toxin-antitoxin system